MKIRWFFNDKLNVIKRGNFLKLTQLVKFYHYVPNQKASSKKKLNRLEQELVVESITFDRGKENSLHHQCNTKTYFCDPYSLSQRGANENQNKLLRRWFPKGTDFSKIAPSRIKYDHPPKIRTVS